MEFYTSELTEVVLDANPSWKWNDICNEVSGRLVNSDDGYSHAEFSNIDDFIDCFGYNEMKGKDKKIFTPIVEYINKAMGKKKRKILILSE